MPDIQTKAEFAASLGVKPSAVSNWIARGKLTGGALTADGRVFVPEATRQLARNIDPAVGRSPAPRPGMAPVALSGASDDPDTLTALRIRRETLAVEAAERQAAISRGELVLAAEVKREWARELDELLSAIELFVTELPTRLGLGRDSADQVRREWRQFRERRAAQAAAANEERHAA